MEIIYILLGAFLAVLTPILTNRISIIYQRKEIKKGINSELDALRIRLAFVSFKMTTKYGNLNTEFLNWFKNQLQDASLKQEFLNELEVSIDDLISDVNNRQSYIDKKKGESRNAVFSSKYSLPFVQSKLSFTQ